MNKDSIVDALEAAIGVFDGNKGFSRGGLPRSVPYFEFAAYDVSKPAGQRYTSHVHIYLDTAEL